MAVTPWSIPSEYEITDATRIEDTDNFLQAIVNDMGDWVNDTKRWTGQGIAQDYYNKTQVDSLISTHKVDQNIITLWNQVNGAIPTGWSLNTDIDPFVSNGNTFIYITKDLEA